jgi:hypothetical protein
MSIDSEAAMAVAFFLSAASVCWSAAFAWAKWLQHVRHRDGRGEVHVPALDQRLERIERAVDAIAVEVERLGEGQRFTVKLLREANPAAKSPALGEPPRVNTPR